METRDSPVLWAIGYLPSALRILRAGVSCYSSIFSAVAESDSNREP